MTNQQKQQQGSLFSTANENAAATTPTTANSETALTTTNAATPATTLEQRVVKIQFHLQNIGNSIIIIGQELIECKKEVGHGNWTNWLKDNFNLSQDTATNFMKIAERFSNSESIRNLGVTQMIQLLKLPAGTEEDFIAEKAAEGNPVENMTIKQEREEIKKYKAKIAQLDKDNQKLQAENGRLQAKIDAVDKLATQYHVERDILQEQLENQKPITVEPNDYQQLKKAEIQLQNKIDALQKQLANKPVEIVTPADYDETKKELARLQAEQSEMVQRMEVFQNLGTIAALIEFVLKSPSSAGVKDFKREHPEEFGQMCANMIDFTNCYYEE